MCGHQVLTVTLSYLLNLYFHVPNPSLSPPSLQASTSYLNELSPCSRHWVCIVAVPLLKVWTLWAIRGFVSNVWLSVLFLLNQELIRAGPNIAVIWRCAPPVHGCAPRPLVMWRLPGSWWAICVFFWLHEMLMLAGRCGFGLRLIHLTAR